MRQPVTLAQDIINFVDFPLTPAGWEAGAHGGHAGWLMRFQGGVAFGVVADESAGLGREIVEGADERVETLADVGGVEGFVFEWGG